MDEWSLPDLDCPINQNNYQFETQPPSNPVPAMQPPPPPPPRRSASHPPHAQPSTSRPNTMALQTYGNSSAVPKGDSPREIRNRNEKMRRDRLNQSVALLASIVPPVLAARRKVDKTTVLRLTAHYLRAHQYVFGDAIERARKKFSSESTEKIMSLFNGFLLTTTYRGIIVVVSQNVNEYLGYTELELLGQNVMTIVHQDDRDVLRDQLMSRTQKLGPNGELLIPDTPGACAAVEEALAREKRNFVIRFKKHSQRSEPPKYLTCHVEGSLRKADKANGSPNRCCPMVRRVRARTENPCSSGNDIVFVGVVRPSTETFINESALEGYRMEYRTRHSIDGQILQCDARIALVTGYMTHEVYGANAMNFMHRDDVRWVVIALREMYDQQKMFGESCYRLITKNRQFIYMKTRGHLVIDDDSQACKTFVCTNTVVDEREGKHLIRLMRKKYALLINTNEARAIEAAGREVKDDDDGKTVPVENPKRLERVILTLVTDLPSTATDTNDETSFTPNMPPPPRIVIIPPSKEKIVDAIEKIYSVIPALEKEQDVKIVEEVNSTNVAAETYSPSLPTISNECFGTTYQENRFVEFNPMINEDIFNFGQAPNDSLQFAATSVIKRGSKTKVEPIQNVVLPDFDNSPGGYSNISSFFENFNDNSAETENVLQDFNPEFLVMDPQMNYYPVPKLPEESSTAQMLPIPSTSNYSYFSGIKRPGEFEVQDSTYKKKITEVASNDAISGLESPTLESFFDESLFNTQIETAMNSLDSIDPSFPDLLISSDVQELLGQLEEEQRQDELPDFI